MCKVSTLMYDITHADIKPDVFKVFVVASDHSTGFSASVNFRSNYPNKNKVSNVETHADTAEEALENLKKELLHRFGKCERCNNYREVS